MDAFLNVFEKTTRYEMQNLFMRIGTQRVCFRKLIILSLLSEDTNADGQITWDDMSSYLLFGSVGQRKMRDDTENKELMNQSFTSPCPYHIKHKDPILKAVVNRRNSKLFTAS